MQYFALLPVVISLGLFAAHLLRHFGAKGAALVLIPLAIVAIPHRWAAAIARIILLLMALEWVRAIVVIALERREAEENWQRMAIILGVVALFTAASSFVFKLPVLRRRYRISGAARATQTESQHSES